MASSMVSGSVGLRDAIARVLIDDVLRGVTTFVQRSLTMTIGMVFYVIAAIVLFLGGIGSTIIPNPVIWGLFCITLGLLLSGYPFSFRRRE